ncbi:MAG TPA: MTH938/NDUFAF3 family protein [Euzebyales bacterium]|nr:MTH938/NDUFAF3 family protein [Euzebyales bacterium]
MASPRITAEGWGHIAADGRTFKDVKLWPGGAREWDWTETGTAHEAGVQPTDVRELVDQGADHVVLSRGREGRLQVHPDTEALLDELGVTYDILPTGEAIARYERLRDDGAAVGALIHTTC